MGMLSDAILQKRYPPVILAAEKGTHRWFWQQKKVPTGGFGSRSVWHMNTNERSQINRTLRMFAK